MTTGPNRNSPPRLRLVSADSKRVGHFPMPQRGGLCCEPERDRGNRQGPACRPEFHGPSPHFLAALIGIGLILAGFYFVHWLSTQQPPVHVERTGMAVRPNPPECDGTCPLYDCLNRRERCPL